MGHQAAITGATRLFVIIGDPIEQVRSPQVFNPLLTGAGRDAVLVPIHVRPDGLAAAFQGFRAMDNLEGIIVTVPHKMAVTHLIDDIGPTGRLVGGVNAVRREPDGRLVGDMFDGQGFLIGLRHAGHDPEGRRALLVGAGGAGSAVGFALAGAGVERLTIVDVDAAKADELASAIASACPHVRVDRGPAVPDGHDLVINATPLGMRPDDPLPLDPARLTPGILVADIIMKPAVTPLLHAAAARGCIVHPGKAMLDSQAEAIAGFFGIPLP